MGESAHAAPASSSGWLLALVREKTVVAYPAFRMWRHIDWPMTPVPMNPTPVVSDWTILICMAFLRRTALRAGTDAAYRNRRDRGRQTGRPALAALESSARRGHSNR